MNIAFAGFRHGHIFSLYNMAFYSEKFHISGFHEENTVVKEQISLANGIEFNYNTFEDILSDSNIDVIGIGDYFSKRGSMVISALKSGKHVICDKPICTSLCELDEIEKLSKEKNLKVMCLLDLRYIPQISKVKELISNGEIGEIININFSGQHFLDYDKRAKWYFEDGKHGGTINDIGIHGIDLVKYITGKNLTKINCAKTRNAFADKEPEFNDCGQFMIEMDNISVMADVSYAAPECDKKLPTYWDFYFWGKDGMINFRLSENVIHLYNNGTEHIIDCNKCETDFIDDAFDEITGKKSKLNTAEILNSQRQVLLIQNEADKYSK